MAEPVHSRSAQRLADSMEKPLLDNRSYRVIKLPNDLEALIIHDPDTDKASAAMDVNVGSFSDPEDMPGMAHAVEHLLFMGTEKYPVENEYSQYLAKYGGMSNAFTASTSTNYYFELSASSSANTPESSLSSKESLPVSKDESPLYGALDRFSQFFVKPLFLEDTLDRELKAVDSENKKNLQNDMWRFHQLGRSLSSKEHPYHMFSTGNYKILHDEPIERGVKIRDRFIEFYDKHYSSNRMKLVVLGRETLDELEGWVQEMFTDVRNQNLEKLSWGHVSPYTEKEVGTQIFAKPIMDQRTLDLSFLYQDEEDLYASQPSRYVSHLIGHEGPGSILAYLKDKGWANGLGAGPSPVCPGTAFFSISVRLTDDGLKHYPEVAKAVFHYIAMLREQPPQEWIVDEISRVAAVDFKFRQKIPASRTTSNLCGIMQKPLPRDWLLSGQSLIRKFNSEAITNGLNCLRPDNFRMTVASQDLPGGFDQKEKWYGTEYKIERIPEDFMQELVEASKAPASQRPKELHLPHENEFVPQRLDVEKKEIAQPLLAPKLIRNDENVRTWFKKDDRFWVPKANIDVALRSPLVNASPLTMILTSLYKSLVEDSLSTYAYDAEIAGLEYSIQNHAQGLDVTVSGYNDKMSVLLEKVLVSMRDLEITEERFKIIKERMLRGLKNFELQQPYQQLQVYSRWLLSERGWANDQLLAELPSVTAADVRAFFPQILKQMNIEILVHGNLYKEDALRTSDLVESTLKPRHLPPTQWQTRRSIVLPPGSDFIYPRELKDPGNVNHCIQYLIFVGANIDRPLRAKLLLLSQMVDEPCFDQLRTKEQLGYIVGSGSLFHSTIAGYQIVIQSERDCAHLEKRVDAFLTNFATVLKDMPEKEFGAHKIGLTNKRLEKLKNLSQETSRFWHHVTSEAFDFETVYHDVENIEPLTKADMIEFYNAYVLPSSPTRAKTSVHLIAQPQLPVADTTPAEDPAEQAAALTSSLSDILSQLGVTVDNTTLTTRLGEVDVAGGDTDAIMGAVGGYLKLDAGLAEEQVEQIMAQGKMVLAQVLPQLGIKPKASQPEEPAGDAEAEVPSKAIVITDVKAFKASMPVSAGARPVKDLSEFEDLEPKL